MDDAFSNKNRRQSDDQIVEGDGSVANIEGYTFSLPRACLTYTGYILSLGLLRLIFHWLPMWRLKCTYKRCELRDARRVAIKDVSEVQYIHGIHEEIISYDSRKHPDQDGPVGPEKHETNSYSEENVKYFVYKHLKYVWDEDSDSFKLLRSWDEQPYDEIVHSKPLDTETVLHLRGVYGLNEIKIKLTPIFKLVVNECLTPFHCFQVFSCILWFYADYRIFAACIALFSIICVAMQTYELRKSQRALKETAHSNLPVNVCREYNGVEEFRMVDSTELVPGDIIEIPHQGCLMYCDAILLVGNCIVNESVLTGESVPVTKTPLPESQSKGTVFSVRTFSRHILFSGTMIIQTRNERKEPVLAVVVRTGFSTTRGELVRCILYPKPSKFKFTQDAYRFVGALAILAIFELALSIFFMYRAGLETYYLVIRSLDLITIAVPPILPIAISAAIAFAQKRLRNNEIHCINPSVINVCGVINVTCFDKTGTLTEDGLDLWGVVPNDDGQLADPEFEPSNLTRGPLIECLASCHSLTRIAGVLSGDPLDLKMFQSTKWDFSECIADDENKFDMVVPAIVKPVVDIPNAVGDTFPYEVGVIRQFPFTSSLQRMSVIARVLNSTSFNVYAKGAPETIEFLCRPDTIPSDFHSTLLEYTREGYRVLALAWKPLKTSYVRAMRISRERVEQHLLFLGFLVMENRLKPETTPVIKTLRQANIRPVMITGDNMLTSLSVARDCEMIDELDRIVIVSAKPPPKQGELDTAVEPNRSVCACSHANDHGPTLNELIRRPAGVDDPSVDETPLVEFHYAEDLHRPVTEVTATTKGPNKYNLRRNRPSPPPRHSSISKVLKNESSCCDWLKRSRRSHVCSSTYTNETANHCYESEVFTVGDTHQETPNHANGSCTTMPNGISILPAAATANYPVSIRMIDRPDLHLAISGKTWGVIKEHYPWLIPKLVVKGTVFARFLPEQKAQVVEALQSVGYFVSMCGDGANDCGALKVAHAGVSLSEAEASVASPFTSKIQNISCMPILIREGRCALVTSFGIFKFISAYSFVQCFSTLIMYYMSSSLSEAQFLYCDFVLITTLGVTFSYAVPYPKLSAEPPNMRLLSTVNLMSLGFQIFIGMFAQVLAFVLVRLQPWYLDLKELLPPNTYTSYENTVVFIVSSYQYIILAIVFSKGAPYRSSLFSNRLFVLNLVICLAINLYLTTYPHIKILDLFELIRIPSVIFMVILHLLVLANFLLGFVLELAVDGVSFRRRIRNIQHAFFPRHVERKAYEKIRDEIDKSAGVWPPIIRSASLQALPKDLFNDTEVFGPNTLSRSFRRRLTSGFSDDSDGDAHSMVGKSTDHIQEVLIAEPINNDDEANEMKSGSRRTRHRRRNSSIAITRAHSFHGEKSGRDGYALNYIADSVQRPIQCPHDSPSFGEDTVILSEKPSFVLDQKTVYSSAKQPSARVRSQSSGVKPTFYPV